MLFEKEKVKQKFTITQYMAWMEIKGRCTTCGNRKNCLIQNFESYKLEFYPNNSIKECSAYL